MTLSDHIAQFVGVSLIFMMVGMLGLLRLNPAILRIREARLKQSVEFGCSISTIVLGLALTLFSAEIAVYTEDVIFLKTGVGLLIVGGCIMAGLAPFSFVRIDMGEALPVEIVFIYDLISKLALIYLLYLGLRGGSEVSDVFCSIMLPAGTLVASLGWLMASVQSSFRRIIFYGSSAGIGIIILCLASFYVSLSSLWLCAALASFTLGYAVLIAVLVAGEKKIGCSMHLMDLNKVFENDRVGAALVFMAIFLLSGAPVVSALLASVQFASSGTRSVGAIICVFVVSISASFYAAATISLRMLNDTPSLPNLEKVG